MTTGKETRFKDKVIKYLTERGAYVIKIHGGSLQKSGEPDIIACYKGWFLGFELKTDEGRPTKLQQYKVKQIQRAGGYAMVTSSLEEIKEVLHEISRLQSGGEPK